VLNKKKGCLYEFNVISHGKEKFYLRLFARRSVLLPESKRARGALSGGKKSFGTSGGKLKGPRQRTTAKRGGEGREDSGGRKLD